jgi:Insertion element 4 transposase N-terminal
MARAGQVKPVSDRRLSDLVSVGLLSRVFPPDVIDEVVAECGRREQRHRALPARTMAYFAIGMALHSDGSYEDVVALMTDGLAWVDGDVEPLRLPSKSGIWLIGSPSQWHPRLVLRSAKLLRARAFPLGSPLPQRSGSETICSGSPWTCRKLKTGRSAMRNSTRRRLR